MVKNAAAELDIPYEINLEIAEGRFSFIQKKKKEEKLLTPLPLCKVI